MMRRRAIEWDWIGVREGVVTENGIESGNKRESGGLETGRATYQIIRKP